MTKTEKKHSCFLIFYFIYVFLAGMFILQKYLENKYFHGMRFILSIGIVYLILCVILFIFLQKALKKKIKLEKLYLILVAVLGIGYLLLFPPGQLPDEGSDYLRTLEISEGHFASIYKEGKGAGRSFSTNIDKVFKNNESYRSSQKNWSLKLNAEKKFYNFANKSLYAFACYLPQLVGVSLGKLLQLPIIVQMALGKITNFLFAITLMYFSIKWLPFKKELLFFIGILPMTIQEFASLSPDAMAISTSIALISYVFYLKYTDQEKLAKKQIALLAMFVVLLSLCKIVYLPLCAVIFFLPEEKFKSKKQKYWMIGILLGIATILNLYWLSQSSIYLKAFHARSNSKEQLLFMLKNPIAYLTVLYRTVSNGIFDYFQMMTGSALGTLSVHPPLLFVFITIYLLIHFITKGYQEKKLLKGLEQLFLLFIVVITILLIFTSLYMQWSSVARETVDGVQGRYFIPLLPYIAALFMTNQEKSNHLHQENIPWITFLIFFNIVSLVTIIGNFI